MKLLKLLLRMGNFLPQVKNTRDVKILIVRLIGLYILVKFARFLSWKTKNLKNQAIARQMLRERNSKSYKF